MPFGFDNEYPDWDACIQANQDKDDPEAYCGWMKAQTEKISKMVKQLLECRDAWAGSNRAERERLVRRGASIVYDLVQKGEQWTPGNHPFARAVFHDLRKHAKLVASGVTQQKTFVKGYVSFVDGQVVVRDKESDMPGQWKSVLKSVVTPVECDLDAPAGGMAIYDLALSEKASVSKAAYRCVECDLTPKKEYIYRRADGSTAREAACNYHFFTNRDRNGRSIVKVRLARRSKLAQEWMGKEALTTGDFGGAGQAPLTIEYPKRKRPRTLKSARSRRAYKKSSNNSGFLLAARLPADAAEQLLVPSGESLADLHITVIYFGPAADMSEEDKEVASEIVADILAETGPIEARVGGMARFLTRDGMHPIVALIDAPELNDLRERIAGELEEAGIEFKNTYAYMPHVTLIYEDLDNEVDSRSANGLGARSAEWPTDLEDLDVPEIDFVIDALELRDEDVIDVYPMVESFARSGPVLKFKTTGRNEMYKVNEEQRYTFTVVYKPDDVDAHDEYVSPDDLQLSLWDHVRAGERDVYVQHGRLPGVGFRKAGEWVELATWPYEHDVTFKMADGSEETRTIPAGSAWMGTIWEPWAWELVKSGDIRGLSFGGTSRRIAPEVTTRRV